MSSPEVERFEMSENDYYQMFDPTGNRKRKPQTKNDATYGILCLFKHISAIF